MRPTLTRDQDDLFRATRRRRIFNFNKLFLDNPRIHHHVYVSKRVLPVPSIFSSEFTLILLICLDRFRLD